MGTGPLLSYFNRESISPCSVGRLSSSYTKEVPSKRLIRCADPLHSVVIYLGLSPISRALELLIPS